MSHPKYVKIIYIFLKSVSEVLPYDKIIITLTQNFEKVNKNSHYCKKQNK